jgi:tRNA(Ile)-lysidine synthase
MKSLPVITSILPPNVDTLWIACSGGIDSLFAAQYFNRTRDIGLAYFNHGTSYADQAEQHVAHQAMKWNVPFARDRVKGEPPKGASKEAWWREQRYAFLSTLGPAVVTGHHLDDAVETWVWGSCHGQPTLPSLNVNNIYRPFLMCKKLAMEQTLAKLGISWIEDPSNQDVDYIRNHIRKNVVPELYKVNPGLDTVIQRKIQERVTMFHLNNTTT